PTFALLGGVCFLDHFIFNAEEECPVAQSLLSGLPRHLRFGSKADMCSAKGHVRFTPESGHRNNYGRSGSNAATRGKITLISVNSPGCVSTSIEPPCCFTMMS